MKAISFWIVLLVVLGAGLCYYLIPSGGNLAQIFLKGNRYKEAEKFYEAQYKKSEKDPEVMMKLSQVYETKGDLQNAIRVMDEYVKEHPDDYWGWKRLADLYYLNQQFDQYNQILLKLEQFKGHLNPDVLRGLADYYRNRNLTPSLISTLQKLIDSGKASDDDYLDLAYLYAQKKDYAKAAELLQTKREFFKKKNNINSILFEVWVNIQAGKSAGDELKSQEKGMNILTAYLKETNDPLITYYALGVVRNDYPKLIPLFTSKMGADLEKTPKLYYALLEIEWENPAKKQEVYQRILKTYLNTGSNTQLQNLVFKVFLDQEDDSHLLEFIKAIPPDAIEPDNIVNLSYFALLRNKPDLARKMEQALGDTYLKQHPMTALYLALGAQDPDAKNSLNQLLKTKTLQQSERYFLLKLAAQANMKEEALQIGSGLPPYRGFQDYELIDIALAYTHIQAAETLYKMVSDSRSAMGEKNTDTILSLLDIPLQRTKKVAKWLSDQKNLSENILSAFYTASEESKEYPLSLYVAKLRLQNYPSDQAEADYALALVRVGKIENGLQMLEDLYKEKPSNPIFQNHYFTALNESAKKNPQYKDRLIKFMDEREKQGSVPNNLRQDFAFTYLETLRDPKRAADEFQVLAENAPPQSDAVKTLIYLRGPRTSARDALWLEKRAELSPPQELGDWLNYLLYIGKQDLVLEIFEKRSKENPGIEAYYAYMDALAYRKRTGELKPIIDNLICSVHDRKGLEKLSNYAEEAEYPEAERVIWEKIACNWPNDPLAWQNLAKAAFNEHDYDRVISALQRFFYLSDQSSNENPRLYESLFELAESLHYKRHYEKAQEFFEMSLWRIESAKEKTPRMIEVQALIEEKLEKKAEAEYLMAEYYKKTSEDPNAAASYANTLMNAGLLKEAAEFLQHIEEGGEDENKP